LAFVLVPGKSLSPYMAAEGQITPSVIHMAQLFGALLVAFGVGCLIQRSHSNQLEFSSIGSYIGILGGLCSIC